MDSVQDYNELLGVETLHPLVSVVDLSEANLEQRTIRCDFYTIILIEGEAGKLMYGRKYYDYSNATLIFRTPGESIKLGIDNMLATKGRMLAFHPDLMAHTALENHIGDYSFFFYKPKITACIRNIEEELRHAIDRHSKTLISRHIELLLDYCARFNERQFITRCEANKIILHKIHSLLSGYILSGRLEGGAMPTEEYCADALHLSPCYFRDLLKFETGKSMHEYFQLMRLDMAKKMLRNKNYTVGMTARKLGYANSQLFKKITGMTPTEYKYAQN